jgi:hypothetical protein
MLMEDFFNVVDRALNETGGKNSGSASNRRPSTRAQPTTMMTSVEWLVECDMAAADSCA